MFYVEIYFVFWARGLLYIFSNNLSNPESTTLKNTPSAIHIDGKYDKKIP